MYISLLLHFPNILKHVDNAEEKNLHLQPIPLKSKSTQEQWTVQHFLPTIRYIDVLSKFRSISFWYISGMSSRLHEFCA